ncbi:MAG TPA: hypothetical protein VGN84_05730 [Solirubrobacterales bacterium]|nr:hypothetical protein [Solirubrobacterales bacterium]
MIAFAVMALWLVFAVSVAQADTGNIIEKQHEPATAEDGWQAGTCTTDTPQCAPGSPIEQFFRTAAGHPQIGFTQYTVKHTVPEAGKAIPVGDVKTIRVDLPPGLTVNPEATERCELAVFTADPTTCPPESKVGQEEVTLAVTLGPGAGTIVPPIPGVTLVPLYNLIPENGEPALFGFRAGEPGKTHDVFLKTNVAWESDYHEGFTIEIPPSSLGTATLKSRLVNFGRSGDGTYLTNPTTCFSSELPPHEKDYVTFLRAEAAAEPEADFPASATPFEATTTLPLGLVQQGCAKVPFDPELEVSPGATQVDSPAGPTVNTKLKFIEGGTTQSESHLRNAEVSLPQGMGLNPSGANGLKYCTDGQFHKNSRASTECPFDSMIGSVDIETPPLPAGSLTGPMYLGQQLSRDPTSGDEFRFFVDAESSRYGIKVRLEGKTRADPKTGQLTTVFTENPQVPFTSVKLHFDGAKNVLTSPPTCAPANATSTYEPWSTPASTRHPVSNTFAMTSAPGGGACSTTLAGRPFVPSYTAKTDNTKANAYSPFRVHIGRTDGQQELKKVNVTLPKGLAGNLTGIPYCPESAIVAAAASSGVAEQASPSCPGASQIGTTSTTSGTGSTPLILGGKAYLAGPFKGAPLSLVAVTPASAGPFDLGTVVVRVALLINPETAQVHAVSDPIPDVYGGVKLDIRSIDFNVDRTKFMHNPTNCAAQATTGSLNGGGANPTDPAVWSSYPVNSPFQATACNKLGFKPKLHTRLFGGKNTTTRGKHPKLRAILEAREGDANILRNAVALPHALFLDQGNIRTVCTRPQLASGTCPKAAIYGHAQAKSPLLGHALKGPVYLVSSDHELPDLLADLRGQVNIRVRGVISSKNGGIKTVFNNLPDVPVSKFILRMEGGSKKGLLVNSRNLCKGPLSSVMSMKGQNGKKIKNNHLPLKVSGC